VRTLSKRLRDREERAMKFAARGQGVQAASTAKTSVRDFACLLGGDRREYIGVTAAGVLIGAAEGLIHPLLIKAILDHASSSGEVERVIILVLGYLVLGISLNAGAYATSLWQQRLDNRIVRRISADLLGAFYTENYRCFLRNGVGHYVSRIRADVKDGLVPMLALVRVLATKISMLLALVSALILISWQAFAVLVVIIPVATVVSLSVGNRIRHLTSTERENEADVLGLLTKAVGSIKMVCGFGLVNKTVKEFDNGMGVLLDTGYKRFKAVRTLQGASDLTMVLSDVCSIFVGALFVLQRKMTFGSFIAFMNSFWRAATTLIAIFKHWAELQSHGATVHRITQFLHGHETPDFDVSDGVIAMDVGFSYNAADVLRNVSVAWKAGRRVLITGDNGSGKTTFANILARCLYPTQGGVSLPSRISAATLPLAFPPLRVGQLDVEQRLLQSFSLDCPEILTAYPDQLSAGQQQKLALAMVLSKAADLYVLDEPLANLDTSAQDVAMREIMAWTEGGTLVMIMHGGSRFRDLFDECHHLGSLEQPSPSVFSPDQPRATSGRQRTLVANHGNAS